MPENEETNADARPTDVILVVKGAGAQQLDTTLNSFLDGFLRAVRHYDSDAKVRIGPERKVLAAYDYTPYFNDKQQDLVEVLIDDDEEKDQQDDFQDLDEEEKEALGADEVGEKPKKGTRRRIWIKEAYWEEALAPPSTLRALIGEWRITSYTLIKLIEQFIFPWQDGRRYDDAGKKIRNLNAYQHSFPAYLLYFFLAYAIALGFIGLTGLWGGGVLPPIFSVGRPTASWLPLTAAAQNGWIWWLGISLFVALGPAFQAWRYRRKEAKQEKLPRMPGLGRWLLATLALALFLEPVNYTLLVLLYAVVILVPLLIARKLAWPLRPDWYTDAPRRKYIHEGQKYIDWQTNRVAKGTQLLYRIFVVIGVPVAVAVLVLIKVVHILDLFGDVGKTIDAKVSELVNQTFGDVTTYALDPAAAARVQDVVAEDIRSFANLVPKDPDATPLPASGRVVEHIHVFAHSQGTPITYEVLFHILSDADFQRVRNYFTIGSVLNLHNLANEMLDEVFRHRFPPKPYRRTNVGFKWFNFWNFTDPITQFTGLDAYREEKLWVKTDGELHRYEDGSPRIDYAKTSPFSIKTRDSLTKNHGEYWSNVEEIHLPLIKHIFRDSNRRWLPDAWASPEIRYRMDLENKAWNKNFFDEGKFRREFFWHRVALLLIYAGLVTALVIGGAAVWGAATQILAAFIAQITIAVGAVINWFVGLLPENSYDQLITFWDSAVRTQYLSQDAVNGTGLVLLLWALVSSLVKLFPERSPRDETFTPPE